MKTFSLMLRRLAALFYDLMLTLAIVMAAGAIASAFSDIETLGQNPWYRSYLFMVIFAFYGGFWLFGGQTLGMRAWKLRLTLVSGKPISLWHALLKFLYAATAVLCLLIANEPTLPSNLSHLSLLGGSLLVLGNYIAMFFNNDARTLQDIFSYTQCQRLNHSPN